MFLGLIYPNMGIMCAKQLQDMFFSNALQEETRK